MKAKTCPFSETASTPSSHLHTCLSPGMTQRFSRWLSEHQGEWVDRFLWAEWVDGSLEFHPDRELLDYLTGIMGDRIAWLPTLPGCSNLTVRVARFCPFGPCSVATVSHRFDRYPT